MNTSNQEKGKETENNYSNYTTEACSVGCQNRLIQEVSPEAQGLLSGEEEILVPYQGWHEEEREFHANQRYQFKQSIKEGDPSLKALMPELFPPVSLSKTGC